MSLAAAFRPADDHLRPADAFYDPLRSVAFPADGRSRFEAKLADIETMQGAFGRAGEPRRTRVSSKSASPLVRRRFASTPSSAIGRRGK